MLKSVFGHVIEFSRLLIRIPTTQTFSYDNTDKVKSQPVTGHEDPEGE